MAISDEAKKRIEETDKAIEEKYLKPPKGFKTKIAMTKEAEEYYRELIALNLKMELQAEIEYEKVSE